MFETSKATARRLTEVPDWPSRKAWLSIFSGRVLDVGSGDDPLQIEGAEVTAYDQPDGSGDDISRHFPNAQFDTIHGSNVLEHMINPAIAMRSWLRILKPGGYIVAAVPDFITYEKGVWPSKWNAGHRSTWSLDLTETPAPIHCKLPEWLTQFPVEVLRCALVTTNYDFSLGPDVDQTFDASKGVECFLEMVLRKL